jgi:hypothetical protein
MNTDMRTIANERVGPRMMTIQACRGNEVWARLR